MGERLGETPEVLDVLIKACHQERRAAWDAGRGQEPMTLEQHWSGTAGWLASRKRALVATGEPDWPDATRSGEQIEHYMLPGSHERRDGPECACGAPWSAWSNRCLVMIDDSDLSDEGVRIKRVLLGATAEDARRTVGSLGTADLGMSLVIHDPATGAEVEYGVLGSVEHRMQHSGQRETCVTYTHKADGAWLPAEIPCEVTP